ncbi:DUF305 domain-containing protein [Paracoccus sp. 11-3]|uniref:DUF305 domain-containing protein n=1 Tax=Paracoccus amoyensis TaxID=2760093 RepID=A0A926GEW0_9RHOB|nr:DUF305 domain-containing protein [Paracoccus amoyensis]MBC9247920.1 DUF305 domain-containing protein [Paracoccus amoyensis]
MTKAILRATGLSPILFALACGAYAQDASQDHSGHDMDAMTQAAPADAATNPATQGYAEAMEKMHEDMAVEPTGNADADFVIGMIPHHQAAIDMAKVVLEHGEDPEIRNLAQEIITAQEAEIKWMNEWLVKNGYEAKGADEPAKTE